MTIDDLLTSLNFGRPTCLAIEELPVKAKGMCHHDLETGRDVITLLPSIRDEEKSHLSEGIFHELAHLNLNHIVRTPEAITRSIPGWKMAELFGALGVQRHEEHEREAVTLGAMLEAAMAATLRHLGVEIDLNTYLLTLIEKEVVTP